MNRERISFALGSVRNLREVINIMPEEELLQALDQESQEKRRPVWMQHVIRRLTVIAETRRRNELVRRYLGEP